MREKPAVELQPDPRWQTMVGTYADLRRVASGWEVSEPVPDDIGRMLEVARELFAHSYFVYEFNLVAVVWSLLALEGALRRSLPDAGRRTLEWLITDAREQGLLSEVEAGALDAARRLRNGFVHTDGQQAVSPGMAAELLAAAHQAVSDLCARSEPPEEAWRGDVGGGRADRS